MLTLLAASYEDGWAFVKRGDDSILLARPPYLASMLSRTDVRTLEKAVGLYGFSSCNEHFENWGDLVAFLKEQFLKARRALGLEGLGNVQELLAHAPSYILKEYLDRVESEMLPAREFTQALNLLAHLMKTKTIMSDEELHFRTIDLIEKSLTEMNRSNYGKESLVNAEHILEHEFPESSTRYGTQQITARVASVRGRGLVWT